MSQAAPPPSAIGPIPVGETMREAYLAVFSSLPLLLRAAALPFLLSLVILTLAFMTGQSAILSFVLMIAGFVPYTLFGVAWHRLTLLGPAHGAPATFPSWRPRHLRFLGYVMVATALVYVATIPATIMLAWVEHQAGAAHGASVFMIVVALAAVFGLLYVLLRFSFVFPAVAVDERYTLANSWAHTRGQALRLFATLTATALPMLVLIWAVGAVFGRLLLPELGPAGQGGKTSPEAAFQQAFSDNAGAFIAAQLILAALNYILMALVVSALSIAFRTATGWVPAAAVPEVPDGDGA